MGVLAWLKGRVRSFCRASAAARLSRPPHPRPPPGQGGRCGGGAAPTSDHRPSLHPRPVRRPAGSSSHQLSLSLSPLSPSQTVDPLLAYARAGTSPRILSRSLALGFAFGICPIVGAPFFFCAAAVGASRWLASSRSLPAPAPPAVPPLHGPALFIGNFASAPAEIALAIPFIRLGEFLTGAPPAPLDPAHLSWATAGGALARGLAAWALCLPLVAAGLAAALEPVVAGLVGDGDGLSPPPTPGGEISEAAGPAEGGDLERGGAPPARLGSDRAPLLPPVLAGSGGRVRRAGVAAGVSPPGTPKGD